MILDIIALMIIAFCIYRGRKKGLVKTLFSTLSFAVALILTFATLNSFFEYAKTTEAGKSVYEKTEIEVIGLEDESFKDYKWLFPETEEFIGNAMDTQKGLSESLGDIVLRSICAVLLFAGYSLIIKLLSKIFDAFASLPVLNTVNKLGGIIAGIINSWVYLVILTCIIVFLLPTETGKMLGEQLESSIIVKWFCDNNPLL